MRAAAGPRAVPRRGPAEIADDPDLQVQQQLAYTLGEWTDPRAGRLLGRLAVRHAEDPYFLAAVLSSAMPHVETMLAEVTAEPSKTAARAQLTARLVRLAADIKASPDVLAMLAARRSQPVVKLMEESLRSLRTPAKYSKPLTASSRH